MDFDALAQSMPGVNEQKAKQQKAARDIMLQRAVGGLPTQATEQQASQQLAQGMAQQAGQDATQAQTQQTAQAAQLQQVSNAQLGNQAQSQLAQRKGIQDRALADMSSLKQDEMANAMLQSRKRVMENEIRSADQLQQFGIDQDNSLQMATIQQRKDLMNLGSDVKDRIVDSRLRFEKDEMGRKFTNERQLSDYILSNARTQQEFDSQMRGLMKDTDQYILTLDIAEKKLGQALQQGYIREKGDLDRAQAIRLAETKAKLEKQKQREMNNKRNRMAAIQAVFTVGGAVAGTLIGPAGTAAGGALGASVGGAVGAAVANS
jgi:hypothetical protein